MTASCAHEYGTTGATIYCVRCDTEWDLVDLMEANPEPRKRIDPATGRELPDPYPEHTKLRRIMEKSQACGEFLDWLTGEKGLELGRYHEHTEDCRDPEDSERWCGMVEGKLYPEPVSVRKLLAEFFSIDEDKLEQEKRAMLDEMRRASAP